MVKKASPNSRLALNCLKAFITGGAICLIGQFIMNILANRGFSQGDIAAYTSVILIFAGAVLTGFGIYDNIGKFGGAGSVVPITGFSNSMTAAAMEHRKEGIVFGTCANMFKIAGPVIVFGMALSMLVGLIYWIISLFV